MARGKKTDIEIPTREEMNNILIKSNWNLLRLCNKKMKEYVEETIITSQSDYSDFSRIKKQSIEMLNVLCDESSRSIKTRLRFKILKKNKFTCQYCGRKAPDVVLHIDHIIPFSKGGLTIENNLQTSCQDCNLGKSNIH